MSALFELLSLIGLAFLGFFVSFPPLHNPRSPIQIGVFFGIPVALFLLSGYLTASTGRGLYERFNCLLWGGIHWCPVRADTINIATSKRTSPQIPVDTPGLSAKNAPQAPTTANPPENLPKIESRQKSVPARSSNSASNSNSNVIMLTDANAQDIWSTSVFSYNGVTRGPGGGKEDDRLRVGGWGDTYVILFKFDLPNVSCGSRAALRLFNMPHDGEPTAMYLNAITGPWSWRRGDRLWWKDLPTYSWWQNRIIGAPAVGTWIDIDISDLFSQWCSGQRPNYGILLSPLLNNNNYNQFYSTRYNGTGDLGPRLVVTAAR